MSSASSMRRLGAVLTLAVAGVVAASGVAGASPPWSAPVTAPGSASPFELGRPIAVSTRTGAAVVWQPSTGAEELDPVRIRAARVDADGAPDPAVTIASRRTFLLGSVVVAGGRDVVVAGLSDRRPRRVLIGRSATGAERLRIQKLGRAATATDVVLAQARSGAAAVAFRPAARPRVVMLAVRPRGAVRFRPAHRLVTAGRDGALAIAVNNRGDALVASKRAGSVRASVRVATRADGGRTTTIARAGAGDIPISAAVRDDGDAVMAWLERSDSGQITSRIKAATIDVVPRPSTGSSKQVTVVDTWSTAGDITPATPVLALATDDRMVVAWSGKDATRAAIREDAGPFSQPQDLGRTYGTPPAAGFLNVGLSTLTQDRVGDVLATFLSNRTVPGAGSLQTALLPTEASAFSPSDTVTEFDVGPDLPTGAWVTPTRRPLTAWVSFEDGSRASVSISTRPAP